MKKHLLLAFLCFSISNLFSQTDFENYTTIKSYGKIPSEFIVNQEVRFNNFKLEMTGGEMFTSKKTGNNFIFNNSKDLDGLYNSGFITFNDPISKYAEQVLDFLLADNQELRSKIKIYTLKSPVANAFMTGDGGIFISVGLMAQLQNEAQLAFVISHELTHYVEKHHVENFIHTNDIISEQNDFSSNEEKLSSIFSYSKEHELDADIEGLKLFYENSGYSISEIENVFDILLYSYLPIDEIKFDIGIFESENYIFPAGYLLSKYNDITAIEDYDDSNSTHPNILKRRAKMLKAIAGKPDSGEKFIISESKFYEAQKIARFELSYLYKIGNDFEKAIFNSYILLKEYPENKYLKTNIAESLYGLVFYKNRDGFYKVHVKPRKIEGYSQQVNHLIDTIKKEELNLLALRYVWTINTEYEDDKYIQQLTDSIILETSRSLESSILDFPLEYIPPVSEQDTTVDYENMPKIEKIKYKKRNQNNSNKPNDYYYKALIDLPENNKLIERYVLIESENEEKEEVSVFDRKEKIKEGKNGFSLGIDTIILINPVFETKIKDYTQEKINSYYSKQQKFDKVVKKTAKKLDLNFVELRSNILSENDINKINDISILMAWIYEIHFQEYPDYIPANQKYIDEIIKKYKTKYFAWVSLNYTSTGYYYYDFYVFDLEKAEFVLTYSRKVPSPAFDFLKSNIYYSLLQTKRTK